MQMLPDLPAVFPPLPADAPEAAAGLAAWMEAAGGRASASHPHAKALLEGIFGNSPFLSRLLLMYPAVFEETLSTSADVQAAALLAQMQATPGAFASQAECMKALRILKGKAALLAGLADTAGWWSVPQVTRFLSEFAERAVRVALDFLLTGAHERGEITLPHPAAPAHGSGIIILGMGKLGAYELNYSSDIDLIVFYEKGMLSYQGRQSEQKFFNKLCHDLVHILQERTADGYVFRTDLRLRPDPASTPPAITTDAAVYYYESVGQNWERAAMIKARAIAGDAVASERFMKQISPFMWRRHLDFAAIADIHSIKRQMDHRLGAKINIPGHNIKLGLGGIREIEFYVQVYQLIWGGREPSLRLRGTLETLQQLATLNLIEREKCEVLTQSYYFLRMLEHRLQMVHDQQTHSLPDSEAGLNHIARFMGYGDTPSFCSAASTYLHTVHTIFASSFRGSETLSGEGNLVFTGVSHDPGTIATLASMGYKQPEIVSDRVMSWHHGSRRCTRTKRARELLTELMPSLLKRLAETANPDEAFLKFDEFLKHLPAGVQLFSLFTAHPQLLSLVATIMGSAPMLAETLSKRPELIEGVLYTGFLDPLPPRAQLTEQMRAMLHSADHLEAKLEMLRSFKHEKQFQAGVQLLKGMVDATVTGPFLSELADVILQETLTLVTEEFESKYGRIPASRFCVIALGRLGSCEITFGSDIDLVFVYDVPDFETLSDGEKGFSASVYYNRLTQRLLTALTTLGKEGRLYEVDTRLRPSGTQGLMAVSFSAMRHYFDELAWTFEFMALTKARVTAGDPALAAELEAFFPTVLMRPRDTVKLATDVREMRERVAKEFPPTDPWNLKYAHGGLMDMDFLAQFLLLKHAHTHPSLMRRSTALILEAAQENGLLLDTSLSEANRFLVQLFNMLRLTVSDHFTPENALQGHRQLLAERSGMKDFIALEHALKAVETDVRGAYMTLIVP